MAWTKTKTKLRDVFSGKNFGDPGGLAGFFKNEYRNEYANLTRLGAAVSDKDVAEFLDRHRT